MKAVTLKNAQARLGLLMDEVSEDKTPVIIARDEGEPAVLVSLAEWNGMEETLYLMSNPRNAQRLLDGIREFEAGLGQERELLSS